MALQDYSINRTSQMSSPRKVDEILSKVAPSEYRRALDMNKGFMKDYFTNSLTNVEKLFDVKDGELSLAKDKDGNVIAKSFPNISEAWRDYSSRATNNKVKPNYQEFATTYKQTKAIYDNMLSNKLAQTQAMGFSADDINEILTDDSEYSIGRYISANARENPEFASYTPAGVVGQNSGVVNTLMNNLPYSIPAAAVAHKLPFIGKKLGERSLFGISSEALKEKALGSKGTTKAIGSLQKWGVDVARGKGDIKKTSGGVNRFLRTAQKIAGPKAAQKIAVRLATMPLKGSIPYLGWAWLAYDLVSLTSELGPEVVKQLKSAWDGEFKNVTI